jgi:glucose/arabinose dehydrogenase
VLAIGGWFWISQPDKARLSEQAVTGRTPQLTETRSESLPTVGIAKPVGWANGAKPTAAAGLQVAAFADKLEHPRWLYRLPNGDVLVAETNSPPREGGGITGWVMKKLMGRPAQASPSPNRITLLRDTNNDGVADQRSTLLTGLNSPTGMALVGGWLYVGNTDALVRYPFTPGQTGSPPSPRRSSPFRAAPITGRATSSPRPTARPCSSASAPRRTSPRTASTPKARSIRADRRRNFAQAGPRADPAGLSRHQVARVYAWGLRNPNGMAFEPSTGALWTVVNERDMLGSDMPPDYLTQVDFGAFYGWPWNYWGGYVDKRVTPERPDLREYSKRPDFALGAHVAPLGLTFAGDAKLGGNWTNGAFVGLHGSWNREPKSGYKVVYVPFGDNGFPAKDAKPVDLLTGFLSADGKTTRGRPVGVITDASGGCWWRTMSAM